MAFTTFADFLDRARCRLDPVAGQPRLRERFDHDRDAIHSGVHPAAVLIPLIPRPGGATVLLTRRPETMVRHPGQIAFPGGKIDRHDANAVAAALREAHEEAGIIPESVNLIACAAPVITANAFRITPVIGQLPPDFEARPDPVEVASVFEIPLDFLFDPANYRHQSALWQGQRRHYVEIVWQNFRVWGITAGIVHDLYMCLYTR